MTPWANKIMPPFNNHLGFVIEEWQANHIKISAALKPEHLNRSDIPHGGFISALVDAATALSGAYSDDPTEYRKAQSNTLYAIGRVTASGRHIYYGSAEVYDSLHNLIASGQGVFRYRQEHTQVNAVDIQT